jgi:hypothetical protein
VNDGQIGGNFLAGGGAVGALMRSHDWSCSPLGPPQDWPQSLRSVVGLLLNSKFPMFVAWGPQLGFLYNDSYAEILGAKHPAALGSRFHDIWAEIWPDISPLIDSAMAGEATWRENLPLLMNRQGFDEQTWFTFSYSPVRDESGAVAGMFCAVAETTPQVLAERHIRAETERLREMFEQAPSHMAVVRGPQHVFELANTEFHRLFGQRALVGMPLAAALPELDRQGYTAKLDLVRRTGDPFIGRGVAIMLPRPGGAAEHFIDFVFQPIKDPAGAVSGVFIEGADVTDRARAMAEARRRSEQLRALAESVTRVAATARLEDKLAEVARAARTITGAPRARITLAQGVPIDDPPGAPAAADAPRAADAVAAPDAPAIAVPLDARDGGRLGTIRLAGRPDATPFDAADEAILVQLAQSAAAAIEQGRAEAALRDSEARYRTLFESIDEGFCVIEFIEDADGRIVDYRHIEANPALAIRSGIPGVVGRTAREVLPDEAQEWIDVFAAVLRSGEPLRFERRLRTTGRWLELFAFRLESPERRQLAVLFHDVSHHREVAATLRRVNDELEQRVADALAERKLLADVVEGADTAVAVIDNDYRWLAVNRAAEHEFTRAYGTRPELGRSMLEQLAALPEHRDALQAVWQRALAGEAFTVVAPFGDPARARPDYELRFTPLRDASGRQIGAYAFIDDVTERLRGQRQLAEAQDALRQAQKMDAIGQLTGGVAHDFNNLLTPIMGALEMLRRRYDSDERVQRFTAGALQAAERARILVQRLLAFARRQHLEPRPVDVRELVANMADLLAHSLGPRIVLALELAEGVGPALVDPNQLELALLNLAVNARDAMAGEGRLTLRVRGETLAAQRGLADGDYVCIAVIDTGVGMDAETVRRATEPFFTTKEVGRGTGLGLSAVQGLAEQSRGAFTLQSSLGRGTTATLWLPVAEQAAVPMEEPPDARSVAAAGGAGPILLVDDEELVRIGTADMLTEAGYRVTQAGSAYQALQLLKQGAAVALLITDYAMPGMTGTQLVREALALRPGLKVMMITGYTAVGDAEAGNLPRLAKPFRQADLAAAVAELLAEGTEGPAA